MTRVIRHSSLVTRQRSVATRHPLSATRPSPFTIDNSPFLTTTYSYDPLYRLTGAGDSSGQSYAYSYDPAGNRLSYTLNGTQVATYTYDIANRLTQVNDQIYTYDANGNLLSDGTFNYSYDSANHLTELSDGLSTGQYIYNGDGVRVAQFADGLRTDYVQDVALPLPQLLTAEQGSATNRYRLPAVGRPRRKPSPARSTQMATSSRPRWSLTARRRSTS